MQERIKEVADRIKELRDILGISPDDMSAHLGMGRAKYLKYENGEEDIPASVLYEISRRLGVEMSLLLTGETPRMHYSSCDHAMVALKNKPARFLAIIM